ncbi:GDYXXLXY domain-containing protein [Clostridium lundense]|uniref:GDYXXLXY domain-containing protein n=1 Tax=Clostridium lundense TaxID=319475 RepID=UPI0004817B65|nr:GDYXXLXY domain-containing protein [Clostridium lundense]
MSRTKKYLLTSLIPLCILIFMCIPPLITQKYGKTIELESRITPGKDTFRGKVLYLDYKISSIKKDKLDFTLVEKAKKFKGEQIDAYAILTQVGSFYDVSHITMERPKSDEVYLKCQVPIYIFKSDYISSEEKIDIIYINYPLDRYFTSSKVVIESDYYKNIDKNPSPMENYNYIVKLKIYRGSAQVVDVVKK